MTHTSTPVPPRHRTLLLRASVRGEDVVRQIGVNAAASLSDVGAVLDVCLSPACTTGEGTWKVADGTEDSTPVGEVLPHTGDAVTFEWGLWCVQVCAVDSYPRDAGTPEALCVGGSGALPGTDFDLSDINARLTGTRTIAATLASARPEVRDVVERADIFDYVPLLQALDLSRETSVDPQLSRKLRELPLENDQAASDAFWVTVLACSALIPREEMFEVVETTMAALGWVEDDGEPLTAAACFELCARSVEFIRGIHLVGPTLLPDVERIDMFRELLRA